MLPDFLRVLGKHANLILGKHVTFIYSAVNTVVIPRH